MDKTIEYIAQKSKELLTRQINSYRSLHQKAGTVIAVAALFAPIFLFLIEKTHLWFRITGSLLILPLIIGIILLLLTLRATKLNQGFDETMFDDLLNKKKTEVETYEIAYNKYSIEQNDKILNKQNNKYNWGIRLIIAAIILSISLLIISTIIENRNDHKAKTKDLETTNFNNSNTNPLMKNLIIIDSNIYNQIKQ